MTESPPALPAAQRWADDLAGWAIPDHIVAAAPTSPWGPARWRVGPRPPADLSQRWAREVLPTTGGTVLDVGCGGGKASLPLAPQASEITGVDTEAAMLDEFARAAEERGVARRTVHGTWPDIAPHAPVADVVVCHHVVYNVADIVPFVLALTSHARLAVIVELPTVHPMSAWTEAFAHFWQLSRPAGPTASDLIAVLRELGIDPEYATEARSSAADGEALIDVARRRLCLASERDDELAAWLAEHPPSWSETMMTLRWPGAAEPAD